MVVLGTTTVKLGKAIGAATKLASQTQACLAPTTEITLAVVVEAAMAEVAVVAWGAPKVFHFPALRLTRHLFTIVKEALTPLCSLGAS